MASRVTGRNLPWSASWGVYGPVMAILQLVPPVAVVLMTRRSPALVTALSVVALGLLQKISLIVYPQVLIPPLVTGLFVWIACVSGATASHDERREPGERMRSHWWMPVVGLALMTVPYLVRASVADGDVPVGMVTAMLVLPVAIGLIVIWIPSFLVDAIGAMVTRFRHREA